MRKAIVSLMLTVGLTAQAAGQTCTGLCLQQVSCPGNGTTTITGTVTIPNGVDPLPNATVYIPNAPVDAFTPGVSCPSPGATPSGSPLVGTTTAVDGTFILTNVPVGTSIPIVAQSGRWRTQAVVPATTACANTNFNVSLPGTQAQGDIPKIAVVTGNQDSVECVLQKIGIQQSEFTDPSGTGRINLFTGTNGPGASPPGKTAAATEANLMSNLPTLENYDVLMLPCQGGAFTKTSTELANIISFANAGGRIYSSHYSYVYLYENAAFNNVVNWKPNQASPPNGTATVNQGFPDGVTLAQWLQLTGASTTLGQIAVNTLRVDFTGVNAPTQTYLSLNSTKYSNPVMQFVFDTPIGAANQCGRVLFNEYHVEQTTANSTGVFPAECNQTAALTPQEKLLEYSLFELTGSGSAATLTPTSHDFGSQAIGYPTAPFTFTWTNNSTFLASVSSVNIINVSGMGSANDYTIVSNNCGAVAAGQSCQIEVTFNPAALGPSTSKLIVGSAGQTLTATLTGTGVPDVFVSTNALDFGSLPVGNSATQTFTLTNMATTAIPVPLTVSGDYTVSSNCGSSIAPSSTCTVSVVFTPTQLGVRNGSVVIGPGTLNLSVSLTGIGINDLLASTASLTFGSVDVGASVTQVITIASQATASVSVPSYTVTGDYAVQTTCGTAITPLGTCTISVTFTPTTTGTRAGTIILTSSSAMYAAVITLTGNGIDFTIADAPTTGTVIAGFDTTTTVLTTPLAGFASPLILTCTTTAPGSNCTPAMLNFTPAAAVSDLVNISTNSQYTVVGYSGFGGTLPLTWTACASGLLLLLGRKRLGRLGRTGLLTVLLAAGALSFSGCSGTYPAKNAQYTAPGTYTYTVSATDGFLVHTATYTLTVTPK